MEADIGQDVIDFYRKYERSDTGPWTTTRIENMAVELPQQYELIDIRNRQPSVVGKGAEGTVYMAVDRTTGLKVAIKRMDKAFEHKILAKRTLRELKLLKLLKHEHVLNGQRRSSTCNQ